MAYKRNIRDNFSFLIQGWSFANRKGLEARITIAEEYEQAFPLKEHEKETLEKMKCRLKDI